MSPKLPIRRTHANEVLQAIRSTGLNAAEFDWSEVQSPGKPDQIVSQLTHLPTGYFYIFDFLRDGHYSHRSPGGDKVRDTQYPGDWTNQMHYVHEWLAGVAAEHATPDLWSAIRGERDLVAAAAGSEGNEPFDDEERRRIRAFTRELQSYVETSYALDEEKAQFIADRLEYLSAAAGRQGRQDWLHTTVGVLFTIVVGVALAPDQATDLFRTAAYMLKTYLQIKGVLSYA